MAPIEELTLDFPAVFGNQPISEVQRILLRIADVEEVYASGCFRLVEIGYGPFQANAVTITSRSEATGAPGF